MASRKPAVNLYAILFIYFKPLKTILFLRCEYLKFKMQSSYALLKAGGLVGKRVAKELVKRCPWRNAW